MRRGARGIEHLGLGHASGELQLRGDICSPARMQPVVPVSLEICRSQRTRAAVRHELPNSRWPEFQVCLCLPHVALKNHWRIVLCLERVVQFAVVHYGPIEINCEPGSVRSVLTAFPILEDFHVSIYLITMITSSANVSEYVARMRLLLVQSGAVRVSCS